MSKLIEKKKALEASLNELRHKLEGGQFKPEDSQEFDRIMAEYNEIDKQIEVERNLNETLNKIDANVEKRFETTKKSESEKLEYKDVYNMWIRFGEGRLSEEGRTMLSEHADQFGGNARMNFSAKEMRAVDQGIATGGIGLYLVPEDFAYTIELYQSYMGPFGQATDNAPFTLWPSASGATMPYPTSNDTANSGALLTEGSDASSAATAITYDVVNFSAYVFTSQLLKVSKQLIQDSGINIPQLLGTQLGERLGRVKNTYCTTGTGSSQPMGLLAASGGATQGKLSATATAITKAEIMDLQNSVNWSYQTGPKVGFMAHQNIINAIRKLDLATSDTVPMLMPSFAVNTPPTLLGKSYWINNAMATALTTGQKVLMYGDFSKFVIRRVLGFSLVRLFERYAELYAEGFVGFERWDSRVINTSAIKYYELT